MTKSKSSLIGSSNNDTTVIVVDFKKKLPIAVFKNNSDEVVLGFLAKVGMSPKKIKKENVVYGENVLMFSKAA